MRPAENDASLSREITKFLKGLMTFSFAGLADILINVVPAVIDSKLNPTSSILPVDGVYCPTLSIRTLFKVSVICNLVVLSLFLISATVPLNVNVDEVIVVLTSSAGAIATGKLISYCKDWFNVGSNLCWTLTLMLEEIIASDTASTSVNRADFLNILPNTPKLAVKNWLTLADTAASVDCSVTLVKLGSNENSTTASIKVSIGSTKIVPIERTERYSVMFETMLSLVVIFSVSVVPVANFNPT